MKCRYCQREIVFVRSIPPGADVWSATPRITAHHAPVNLHDAELFGAGAVEVTPSRSYRFQLRKELEVECHWWHEFYAATHGGDPEAWEKFCEEVEQAHNAAC